MSSGEVVLDTYADIREALYHPDLSRSFDRRSFEEGNPRGDILSVLHGGDHKARRRLENPLFRRSALVEYEQELFPRILADLCAREAVGRVDLFELSGAMAVVLAARRAGIDHDGSREQLLELWRYVILIAQASAILDVVGDRARVQAEVSRALLELDERYVTPSRQRRAALLDAIDRGETDEEAPFDLVTAVLRRRRRGEDPFDDGVLAREAGLYLHGGSHTSAQTTCNAFYYLLGMDGGERDPGLLERAAGDPLLAQRVVHETLRLRPTTPRIRRLAEEDAVVGGVRIRKGATVVLDVRAANRDPALFGAAPEEFNPERSVRDDVALWGLSFGAGSHICIGRSVAGGFPLHGADLREGVGEGHLYGLVGLMVQSIAARGVRPDPDLPPELDQRTDRGTRWARFPVVFPGGGAPLDRTLTAKEQR
jgi:cytochrome P450